MRTLPRAQLQKTGFSLVEILAVLVVIAILAALSLPLIKSVKGANNLTYFADEFTAAVQSAKQRASTQGKNVVIRIYKMKGESNLSAEYRAFQIWEQKDPTQDPSVNGTAWVAVGKRIQFRQGIIALDSTSFSSLLSANTAKETIDGISTTFCSILFTPAGRVDLPSNNNFITFVEENHPTPGPIAGLPANFATISIEPFNGRPFLFRP